MNDSKKIDDYISGFSQDVQILLRQVYDAIKAAVPDAEEAISYGMPTLQVKGKNLVHFAAFKKHIGFYPTPGAIAKFHKELSSYKGAKGSVQFPVDKPMPLDLIKSITRFRLQQVKEKANKAGKA